MTAIPAPPVGARVRHTATYTDGTIIIREGIVVACSPNDFVDKPHICIGPRQAFAGPLEDLPGVYEVAIEVLEVPEPPIPPEPVDGYYLDQDGDLWRHRDGDDPGWYQGSDGGPYDWAELNRTWAPLVRLIPDPADSAPTLPWLDGGDEVKTDLNFVTPVWIVIKAGWHSIEEAEEIAAAILRGVREARQG
jgi:hypothetical protein